MNFVKIMWQHRLYFLAAISVFSAADPIETTYPPIDEHVDFAVEYTEREELINRQYELDMSVNPAGQHPRTLLKRTVSAKRTAKNIAKHYV